MVLHRSAAAEQGALEGKWETKDELLEEESISLDKPPAVEFSNARNGKINVTELRVVTENPLEVITGLSPKCSLQTDERFMDAVMEKPISTISGNPSRSLNLIIEQFELLKIDVEVRLCNVLILHRHSNSAKCTVLRQTYKPSISSRMCLLVDLFIVDYTMIYCGEENLCFFFIQS